MTHDWPPPAGPAGSRTLIDALLYHAQEAPRSACVHDVERELRITYSEMEARAGGFASMLARRGVRGGDRIAIVLENRLEWVVAFLGCLWLGAVAVPVNTRWSRQEVSAALGDCDPTLVLTEPRLRKSIGREIDDRVLDATELPAGARGAPPSPRCTAGALGLISYTSGTTGTPKGVMLTQGSLFQSSAYYAGIFNSGPTMTTPVSVPLFHNTGFIDGLGHAVVAGASVDIHRRFSAVTLGARLAAGDYSFFIGVPTMYTRIAAEMEGAGTAGSEAWLAYGGGAMQSETLSRLRRLFPRARFVNCYGLSEATSITHYLPWRLAEGRWGTAGIPVPGTWDRVEPSGELLVDSPTVMLGYWRREAETAARLVGGWLRTGDMAERDRDGILRVLGRIDDVINRGGEKIAPLEVESALCTLDDVVEAAVVGVADPDLGQVPAALVVLRPGHELDSSRMRDQLRERIADYKVPVFIRSAKELPRNANGKVLTGAVRTRLGGEPEGLR
jgi:long-chain acyl-CoA synthetase